VLKRHAHGVTIVELMIGLAIVGVLLMMGVPAFTNFLQNSKLRATAESCLAALQTARTEALTRNGIAEVALTDDEPIAPMVNTLTAATTGKYWVVRFLDPATGFYTFIQGSSSADGSGQATASSVVVTSTHSIIPFSGLGVTTLGTTATIAVTNPAGGACVAASGPMRCLNVVISPTGQVRMCDPAVTAAGDTRRC